MVGNIDNELEDKGLVGKLRKMSNAIHQRRSSVTSSGKFNPAQLKRLESIRDNSRVNGNYDRQQSNVDVEIARL